MSNSIIIHQPQYIWPNYGLLSHILNSGLDCVAVSLLSTYAKPPPIEFTIHNIYGLTMVCCPIH